MSLEILSVLIALAALSFSIITYFLHDSKINKQSLLINQFQLEKFINEKEVEKKAYVETHIIKQARGKRTLKIYNTGKSIAENVVIEIPDLNGLHVLTNPCPIEIRPKSSIAIEFIITKGAPDMVVINVSWKDEFNSSNIYSQKILL